MFSGTLTLASDCKTGPREIYELSQAGPITKMKITDHGILLPLPSTKVSQMEWITAITTFVEMTTKKTQMIASALNRVADFSEENVVDIWKHAIEE